MVRCATVGLLADRDRENAEVYRLLVESIRDYAIVMLDPAGEIMTWNEGAERIEGYAAAEAIGQPLAMLCPQNAAELLRDAREKGRVEQEAWYSRKDRTRFWGNLVLSSIDETGSLTGFSLLLRDLTTRFAAEERFRLLVEGVRDYAIFMLDPEGHIATWNRGAERIKGYSASEIIGRHFSVFYPEEDIQAGKCEYELAEAIADGQFEDEGWRLRKDGTRFWANVLISAVRDASGALIGFSKVTRDLTDRRRAEEEAAARKAAEHANRSKDEFLAILGHELRNPLAPIRTALQLAKLRYGHLSREQLVIERQVNHMIRLVDDLLDISRITRGTIELKKEPIDVRRAVAAAIEIAGPLLEQKQHRLDVDAPEQALLVEADETRLAQVFANLLTNAAKYTAENGRVQVRISEDGDRARIEVRDNGIGIDPQMLPRIYDLFVQGPQDPDRPAGGLGLGLSLVRTLVSLHGGTVEAYSAGLGEGSRFVVCLPRWTAQAGADDDTAATTRIPAMTRRTRVLLVDDNDDARELLAEYLLEAGHDVRNAATGLEALELASTFHPEVALLDIGLPVMDGYELGGRLRELLAASPPRLVALTGYGGNSDRNRSREAGFDAHLVKPIDLRKLLEVIGGVTPAARSS